MIMIGTALLLLWELCLPDADLLLILRVVVYLLVWSVILSRVLTQFWRDVLVAEKQFASFSWEGVQCYCCSVNHQEDGRPIACDREALAECIINWFGSLAEFEECVRGKVCDLFVSQVTRLPFGYSWLVGASMSSVWGYLDSVAARAHGGAWRYVAGQVFLVVNWWLVISPITYLTCFSIARWLWSAEHAGATGTCCRLVAFAGFMLNAFLPFVFQYGCFYYLEDPLIATATFVAMSWLASAAAYYALARPRRAGRIADTSGA